MKATIFFSLFSFTALSASASSVYSFSAAPTTTDATNLSFGFQFSTNSAISIFSLGYFDEAGTGFSSSHAVGIFDTAGNLLASTILDSGVDGTLEGQFRFETIDPVMLAAGQSYVIAATSGGASDPWAYVDSGNALENFTVDSRISIAKNGSLFSYQADDVLRDPADHFAYTTYAGPSFEIASSTLTPEPATGFLVGWASAVGIITMCKARGRRMLSTDALVGIS